MKAYTLIEVLIALSVFAILASITTSVLYKAFDSRARVYLQAKKLNELQLIMSLLQRETTQITDRGIHANQMRSFPAFIGQPNYIEFTHRGAVNPGFQYQRSTLKRVAYLCQNGQLIRRVWERLDQPDRQQYQDAPLLTKLTQCGFSYLSRNHQILSEWRENAMAQNQTREPLPIAIQLNVTFKDWGNLNLLFPITEGLYANG